MNAPAEATSSPPHTFPHERDDLRRDLAAYQAEFQADEARREAERSALEGERARSGWREPKWLADLGSLSLECRELANELADMRQDARECGAPGHKLDDLTLSDLSRYRDLKDLRRRVRPTMVLPLPRIRQRGRPRARRTAARRALGPRSGTDPGDSEPERPSVPTWRADVVPALASRPSEVLA